MDFIYDSDVFIDLYTLLDIDAQAESNEIKNAYIKLVKVHHPDHGGNTEMFQQITKAYEILHNKETRKEYDLYYLKKSMDEIRGDDYNRLKADYKNYVDANKKPVSKEKLDEIYADMFKDREQYKETKIDNEELKKRFNDIGFERDNDIIENSNNKLKEILDEINTKSDQPVSISDLFEYLQYKKINSNTSTELMVGELGTLDTLPGYGTNYTSFVSDSEYFGSNLYSDINGNKELNPENAEISYDDFSSWKNNKHHDTKLSSDDIQSYLERRKNEENFIFNQVESDLHNSTKKREVEKFLKTRHLTENIDDYYNRLHDKPKSQTNLDDNTEITNSEIITDFKPKSNEDMLDYMDRIKNEDKKVVSNVRKREFK